MPLSGHDVAYSPVLLSRSQISWVFPCRWFSSQASAVKHRCSTPGAPMPSSSARTVRSVEGQCLLVMVNTIQDRLRPVASAASLRLYRSNNWLAHANNPSKSKSSGKGGVRRRLRCRKKRLTKLGAVTRWLRRERTMPLQVPDT